jgi:predicted ATPase
MREIKTYGSITDGELKIYRRKEFLRSLAMLAGRVEVIIRRVYRKRSTPQNAYYWGVIVSIARECISEAWQDQIEHDQAHEILKQQCNAQEVASPVSVEVITVSGSTQQLTTVEAAEYYERCRRWIMDFFGVDVPLPNEQTKMEL